MPSTSLKRRTSHVASVTPAAKTASTNGASADLAAYEGAVVVFLVGTITDGTHTPKLQESNDNSSFSDVAAGDQEGTLAALATGVSQAVGYKGRMRYLRAVVTVSGATTGGVYGASILRGDPQQTPAP